MGDAKVPWRGTLLGVQPRIRLTRSFDQRHHSYLGFVLFLRGAVAGEAREFSVGIGSSVQARHEFRAGDEVSGEAVAAPDPQTEPAEFYKASALRVLARGAQASVAPPPWLGAPPALETYRARGHRRLDARTYEAKCRACLWGCRMPVELIVDQWNPKVREHRTETFCYGPKSCPAYRAGPRRKAPGRKGMQWEEEDWVDEEATAHRGAED
jgi:hypothetical protein